MRVAKRSNPGLRAAGQAMRQRLARARRLQRLNDLRARQVDIDLAPTLPAATALRR